MHCPSCGNESSLDQKFCRKCGFNLEPVSRLVSGNLNAEELKLERAEREKLALRRMVSWMGRGMLILLMGVVLMVINKQFHLHQLVGLLSTFIILAGVSVAMYGLMDAMRGGRDRSKSKAIENADPDTPANNLKADTTRELEERMPIPLPSVTERTTQLIGDSGTHASGVPSDAPETEHAGGVRT
jgi:hypothetical protein